LAVFGIATVTWVVVHWVMVHWNRLAFQRAVPGVVPKCDPVRVTFDPALTVVAIRGCQMGPTGVGAGKVRVLAQVVGCPPVGVTTKLPDPGAVSAGMVTVMLPSVQLVTVKGTPFQLTVPLVPKPPPKIVKLIPGWMVKFHGPALSAWPVGQTTLMVTPGVGFGGGGLGAVVPS
jgi:hypothetical protein